MHADISFYFSDMGLPPALGAAACPMPLPVIVPSWVMTGTVAENMAFVRGKATGMMLCCFESEPRLPLGLPTHEAECLPGTPQHAIQKLEICVHLPTDLPWHQGGAAAAAAACCTVSGVAHVLLPGWLAIVHPPPGCDSDLLASFVLAWQNTNWNNTALLLENTPTDSPEALLRAFSRLPPESLNKLGLCLDVAHAVLAGWDYRSLPDKQAAYVRMIHWSAPLHGRDAHAPLTALSGDLLPVYQGIATRWAGTACGNSASVSKKSIAVYDVIEVFDWSGVMASWPLLHAWRQ